MLRILPVTSMKTTSLWMPVGKASEASSSSSPPPSASTSERALIINRALRLIVFGSGGYEDMVIMSALFWLMNRKSLPASKSLIADLVHRRRKGLAWQLIDALRPRELSSMSRSQRIGVVTDLRTVAVCRLTVTERACLKPLIKYLRVIIAHEVLEGVVLDLLVHVEVH